MPFHILELKNSNSASNFGLQSDPRRFFLIFYHLTLNLALEVKRKVVDGAARIAQHAGAYFEANKSLFGQ